jgi:hypothetical protein
VGTSVGPVALGAQVGALVGFGVGCNVSSIATYLPCVGNAVGAGDPQVAESWYTGQNPVVMGTSTHSMFGLSKESEDAETVAGCRYWCKLFLVMPMWNGPERPGKRYPLSCGPVSDIRRYPLPSISTRT